MIERKKYSDRILKALHKKNCKVIFLNGPREAGKTTILKQVMNYPHHQKKLYYFSFDESILAKQFQDTGDFVRYMQITCGIDFTEESLLFLNEIQYSNQITHIISELANDPNIKTQIIATGIHFSGHTLRKDQFETITVYPLTFFEFLEYKKIYTQYLTLEHFSPIVYKEIEPLFEEFLMRGGYPSVVTAPTSDAKQNELKKIMQKMADKDIGFWFTKEKMLGIENFLQHLASISPNGVKISALCRSVNTTRQSTEEYLKFLSSNFLISTLPLRFTDKNQEVSHQNILYFNDTGILNYLLGVSHIGLNRQQLIKTFVFTELLKNKSDPDTLYSYKKINGSSIDFILAQGKKIIPIDISFKNNLTLPKAYKGFCEKYSETISFALKVLPQGGGEKSELCEYVPYVLVKDIFEHI